MYRWISGVLLAAVMLGVVGVGCGGGGGGDTSSSLTKAEFVKHADAICAERKKAWDSAVASFQKEVKAKKGSNPNEIAERVLDESMIPALNQELESFEELGAPEGKEKQVDKFVKNLSKQIQAIEKEGVQGIAEAGFGEVAQETEALGLTCPL